MEQPQNGGNVKIKIEKIHSTQQAPPPIRKGQSNVADYLRPILYDMVNREYQDVCLIKYHKDLTVDLGYMGSRYIDLYKALHREDDFSLFGILQDGDYTKHIVGVLVGRIKGYIKYYCEHLNYGGVTTYRLPMITADNDFLDIADQQLYERFEAETRAEIDREMESVKAMNPSIKVNYSSIPIIANEKFNKLKKDIDPNYKAVKLIKAWVFEVDGNFQPCQQTVALKPLNTTILNGFLNAIGYNALRHYSKSQEYQEIKAANNEFVAKSGLICGDKAVRQALTIKNRAATAMKKGIAEKSIMLDFSLLQIDSYISHIQTIVKACRI
jgi:hypothetical protein